MTGVAEICGWHMPTRNTCLLPKGHRAIHSNDPRDIADAWLEALAEERLDRLRAQLRGNGRCCLGHGTTAADVINVLAALPLAPEVVELSYTKHDDGIWLVATGG